MKRTYVRRSEHEMKRNAEIGLSALPSIFNKKAPPNRRGFLTTYF
jgi:hypothetical protein